MDKIQSHLIESNRFIIIIIIILSMVLDQCPVYFRMIALLNQDCLNLENGEKNDEKKIIEKFRNTRKKT